VCQGKDGCTTILLMQGECLDGDACTIGDHCEDGVCIGAAIDCDDENPCTDDVCDGLGGCDFLSNSADCDDGNPCTVADTCKKSVCVGFAVDCKCQVDKDCAALDDGNPCTGTLVCNQDTLPYQCQVDPDTVVQCPPPQGSDAFCLASVCNPSTGKCEVVPDHEGMACSDGNACTVGESCQQGDCTGGVQANCNDGNPCTDDSCQADSGCAHTPNSLPCQDGDACTVGDKCANAACTPGAAAVCDDKNPCTDDGCDPKSGCTHTANAAACNDGNDCTTGDQCSGGLCLSKATLDCDDKNPCTDDACLPGGGCKHTVNKAPCSDQNACTVNDTCSGGLCVPGISLACNDGNPCTDDVCDQQFGCLHEPNTLACDDGNACTVADKCKAGTCQSTAAPDCDDGNVCTTDKCSPVQGCLHTLNTAPCDDGNFCTLKDQCQLGQCVGAQPAVCNDNNPCTDDSCVPESGCIFKTNQAACDDGSACTTGDTCKAGWCQGTALACNDSNLCTDDSCDPKSGCAYTPNTVPCDDGNACTSGDVCAAGKCAGPGGVSCDDSNLCTDDSCDPKTGCQHVNNTAACNDANACTVTDVCAAGKCVGSGALSCTDGLKCTTDGCDPKSGCVYTPITPCCGNGVKEAGEQCDDGNEIDGDSCKNNCTSPPVADWRIGTWNGVPVYGIKKCPSGDYYCQAKDACEQATGATCVWQEYNCSSYPNENGSFYPTSNPLGRSVSTSGSSSLNWTVTSGCSSGAGGCSHGNSNVYGNLCCCSCNNTNQLWNEGNNYCGVGIWEPY
jgi:cysteine-rich repeat protein